MFCSEIVNPNRHPRRVDLNRYSLLHPEGKQLISGWFSRAWQMRDCQPEESFEPFIFTWFAFNGWAACVTDTDRDWQIIEALAADESINGAFDQIKLRREQFSVMVDNFVELLPIFDVRTLRRRGIRQNTSHNRRDQVLLYLSQGANRFEPQCWQRHFEAGENIPSDWSHIIKALYKVRCNLFHGLKAAHSEMDSVIVHSAYLVLSYFLSEARYFEM